MWPIFGFFVVVELALFVANQEKLNGVFPVTLWMTRLFFDWLTIQWSLLRNLVIRISEATIQYTSRIYI